MNRTALALVISSAMFAGAAHSATFVGTQSDSTNVEVGASTVSAAPAHVAGRAGIGGARGKVDFQGLSNYATLNQGIHQIGNPHGGSSAVYSFAQVASQDIWFGEWSSDGNFTDRTVYYIGEDDVNTSVPTTGTASYNVKGVNHFDGTNALAGTLTADFGAQTLAGSISNASLKIEVDAFVNSSTASFSGDAIATAGGVDTFGDAQGHFFGADAAALAGIATFAGNSQHDTAFGGAKQ
ncbi:transferrin-binding protein-like solute binding protein [Oceanimonas baumannii]|uniref:Slam-dependent surface lipoprotein n=1 Tax=Oceanimonas baumannii TaxID=129578 RepID=UPI001D18D98C|nr:Slam-dependent surface lipoprotein [Oceanimonas baumannii]MCC4264481.1 transferrin-binding protein-like solute binding protein [Oceanimonas baumannii]